MTTTDGPERLPRTGIWKPAIRPTVVLKDGARCALWKHFNGCPRSIMRMLEQMAERDPERFVWPKVKWIWSKTVDWRGQETPPEAHPRKRYSLDHVRRSLGLLTLTKVLERAERWRSGGRRRGWFVAKHESEPGAKACEVLFLVGSYRDAMGSESWREKLAGKG